MIHDACTTSRAARPSIARAACFVLASLVAARVPAQSTDALSALAQPAPQACLRGAAPPLVLGRPFVTVDSVTLLGGELVANAADGRGFLAVDYLTRPALGDSVARRSEAEALARAIAPVAGSVPYAALTLRACRGTAGAAVAVESFEFVQGADGTWRPVPPESRPARGATAP